MAASEDVGWDVCERCAESGGIGVRLPGSPNCWAHTDEEELEAALKRLGEHGRLDARGVTIDAELLKRILAAAPREADRTVLQDPRFDRTRFEGEAGFDGAIFEGEVWFANAIFMGRAGFEGATFQRNAWFRRATFQHNAGFGGATFQSGAWFNTATFQRDARFHRATFQGGAWFTRGTFQRDAWFDGATFQRDAGFHMATFQHDARFEGTTFLWPRQLGPMLVRKSLRLDHVVFHERIRIEVVAAAVCCQRARFLAGVQLRMRWAQVVLEDADLAAPSSLTGVPAFPGLEEGRWAGALARLQAASFQAGKQPTSRLDLRSPTFIVVEERPRPIFPRPWGTQQLFASADRPRLVSVVRADVAGLTVANTDLRACRFADAQPSRQAPRRAVHLCHRTGLALDRQTNDRRGTPLAIDAERPLVDTFRQGRG